MKKLLAGALLASGLGIGSAHAAPVASITIADIDGDGDAGAFGMGAVAPEACNGGPFGSFQCILPGSSPTITMGVVPQGPSHTAFNFFNAPVSTDTAASHTGAANAANGGVPSGDTTAGTLDLPGWYAFWNGTYFLQAPDAGTMNVTYNMDGTFTASWSSFITTAPFDGQTGYWQIEGTYTVVPVPAAVWLFGSGLLGLVGIARRRKGLAAA